MSNKTYKMIERQNGILLSPTNSDLFRRPRNGRSRNVLVYLNEEDINGDQYPIEYPFALELAKRGFDVYLATEPNPEYAENADIIINRIHSEGFPEELYRLNGDRRIITRDYFQDVKNSRDLRKLACIIDEEVSKLKESKEAA